MNFKKSLGKSSSCELLRCSKEFLKSIRDFKSSLLERGVSDFDNLTFINKAEVFLALMFS
jgi:hypothetical protein